ncbi:hypothetical protein ZIOFF_001945 [Zingiber officinale]|uniref:Uncharacterized protein n=1 Tax=Zingiber officinale TaxID=94328 RepID=A0A8J5IKK6_ZINOF|nr:hypothetical protein ZIOFF_001945 [Zingiber officinale]
MAASLQSAVFLSNRIDPHRRLFASPARSLPGTKGSISGRIPWAFILWSICSDSLYVTWVIEDMSIQVNVLALAMEEVAPLAISDAAMLAPEEIFHGKGNIKEEAELTKEERKRRRANQKRRFRRLKAPLLATRGGVRRSAGLATSTRAHEGNETELLSDNGHSSPQQQ